MLKNKGSNLIEYAIPLALVAIVVGLGLHSFVSSGAIKNYLINSSSNSMVFKDKNQTSAVAPEDTAALPVNLSSGSFGGSLENPVKQCDSDSCTIDYGEYILNNIPLDYGGFVEAHGVSGGTDLLASLVEQIASQLEDKGDLAGAQDFRDLANLGHFISDMQQTLEETVATCPAKGCVDSVIARSITLNPTPEVAGILTSYDPNISEISDLLLMTRLDLARNDLDSNPTTTDPATSPALAMVELFDKINSDPDYSDTVKSITKELFVNINDLGYDLYGNIAVANTDTKTLLIETGGSSVPQYDPITGDPIAAESFNISSLDDILHPQTSSGTDLNSLLICTTGGSLDDGSSCE